MQYMEVWPTKKYLNLGLFVLVQMESLFPKIDALEWQHNWKKHMFLTWWVNYMTHKTNK